MIWTPVVEGLGGGGADLAGDGDELEGLRGRLRRRAEPVARARSSELGAVELHVITVNEWEAGRA